MRTLIMSLFLMAASLPAEADISAFAFAAGQWQRDGDGAAITYDWKAPVGDVMVGTFVVPGNDGAFRFAELILVEDTTKGLVLRLKHHNRDYTTWEKDGPLVLRLVESRTNHARFEDSNAGDGALKALSYTLDGGQLIVGVEFAGRTPATRRYNKVY